MWKCREQKTVVFWDVLSFCVFVCDVSHAHQSFYLSPSLKVPVQSESSNMNQYFYTSASVGILLPVYLRDTSLSVFFILIFRSSAVVHQTFAVPLCFSFFFIWDKPDWWRVCQQEINIWFKPGIAAETVVIATAQRSSSCPGNDFK